MGYGSRYGLAVAASLISIPFVFFTIIFGWAAIDYILGSLEVSRFIREHQAMLAKRLSDPKVHTFSLGHAPDHSATLLIRFDVDDKATYLVLEDDLRNHWGLRFPAKWDTRLRSKEDLENNYGFAAQGMSEVGGFVVRILDAAIASAAFAGAVLWYSVRRLRTRPVTTERLG